MSEEFNPLLLSINDAARSIGVCRATFYDLLNKGFIESVKIGSRHLIVQKSLNAYVESLQSKAIDKSSN